MYTYMYIHVPVQGQVDLGSAKPHVHHVMYVGGSSIAGKVGIQKVLLEIVEMESLRREGVRPCHLVFWGRGRDGGLDLLGRELRSSRPSVTTVVHDCRQETRGERWMNEHNHICTVAT